jgi:hypothetical protein
MPSGGQTSESQSQSPLFLALTHSKVPAIYFFSGYAGVAIKFMDSMAGVSI